MKKIWTVCSASDKKCTFIKKARSSTKIPVKRVAYTVDQIAEFEKQVENLCYKITECEYSEDDNMGIRFDEHTSVTYKPISKHDWVIEGERIIGFLATDDEMLAINEPQKTIWDGDSYKVHGYTYACRETTYSISQRPSSDE